MEPRYDGFVSRHLNRRISDPLSRLLAKTFLTPNQATFAAAIIACMSCASFLLGWNIVGGVLAQVSSMVGTLCISYTRAKVPDAQRNHFNRGIASAASRSLSE